MSDPFFRQRGDKLKRTDERSHSVFRGFGKRVLSRPVRVDWIMVKKNPEEKRANDEPETEQRC